jgi:hypothetical protein
VARFSCKCCQTAHEGAANTKNVNVHRLILGGRPDGQAWLTSWLTTRSESGQNAACMTDATAEIAGLAARWVVEEGMEYGPAKRQATKQLGLGVRAPMPSNDVLEAAVMDYIAVFCADTQATELAALRRLALSWMTRLSAFRPHLSGAVWHGTATRKSDIYLQLFCDDSKSAEIALIDQGAKYLARTVTGFQGEPVDALSVHAFCAELNEEIGVHLMIHDYDDMRGALKPDNKGRPPRGDAAALSRLLHGVTA